MKLVDVKPSTYIDFDPKKKKKKRKNLNLKLVTLLEYRNIKLILQKSMFKIGLKKCLRLKVENTALWTYVISDLNG